MRRLFAKGRPFRLISERPQTTSSIAGMDPRNRRRSERVLLQVPVNLEIPQPDGRFLRGDAYTLCVNAHGGLLEMGTRVDLGQKLILANPGSGMREPGRVVHCDKSQDGYFAVAFEFDHPAPDFWPLIFPPSDWKHIDRSK